MQNEIIFEKSLFDKFVCECKEKYPRKAFGYFISSKQGGNPEDFIMFENDIRNEWKDTFEQYGNYYVNNSDAGFLATEEEIVKVHRILAKRKKFIVGVYHSHQRHPAIFSTVDIDLHPSEKMWHIIISLRNFENPQIKAFSLEDGVPKELDIVFK